MQLGVSSAILRLTLKVQILMRVMRGASRVAGSAVWSGWRGRHLGYPLAAGDPHIRHARRSDPLVNLEKEAPGIRANEQFWKIIEETPLDASTRTPLECAEAVGRHLAINTRGNAMLERNPTLKDYLAEEGERNSSVVRNVSKHRLGLGQTPWAGGSASALAGSRRWGSDYWRFGRGCRTLLTAPCCGL